MVLNQIFKLDEGIFQGWELEIDVDTFVDVNELLDSFKGVLIDLLTKNNLYGLSNLARNLELKINGVNNFGQLMQGVGGAIFFVTEVF